MNFITRYLHEGLYVFQNGPKSRTRTGLERTADHFVVMQSPVVRVCKVNVMDRLLFFDR